MVFSRRPVAGVSVVSPDGYGDWFHEIGGVSGVLDSLALFTVYLCCGVDEVGYRVAIGP